MRRIVRSAWLFLVLGSLLLTSLNVLAERYVWTDGQIPENWEWITETEQITATEILSPVNPYASQEAKNLYAYLCTVRESDSFITGLFDMNANNGMYEQVKREFGLEPGLYSTHYAVKSLPFADITDKNDPCYKKENGGIYLEEASGEAVIPEDLMTFTDAEHINALAKEHYENGNILLLHADEGARKLCPAVLIAKGKYDSPENAIVELDSTNPDRDMQAYALWSRYQDNQIHALKQLEDSGVKAYLLRFWIEFNYEGFHGMDAESEASFVRVFQQTTQRLIDGGLTGFLVTYSPGTGGETLSRNPGNDYVDCYGVTLYSPDTDLGHINAVGFKNYDWFIKTGKPIGFTEFSCRTGIWKDVAKQARGSSFDLVLDAATAYPRLTFVNFWGDGAYSLINNEERMPDGNDDGRTFMDNPFTLELQELVDYRHVALPAPGVAQIRQTTDAVGSYHGLEEKGYTWDQLKASGIDPTQIRTLRTNADYAITFYEGENCTGKEYSYIGGNKGIDAQTAAKFRSLQVKSMQNVALNRAEIYASFNDDQAYKANDGNNSFWSGITDASGQAWLMVDLGSPHVVNHYVVKCGGVNGMAAIYNLRDFQFQYSSDGRKWITAATAVDNTLSKVDAGIEPVSAQYFRLLITGANSAFSAEDRNTAVVAEFELYGIPDDSVAPSAGDGPEEDPPLEEVISEHPDTSEGSDAEENKNETSSDGGRRKKVVKRITQWNWWVYGIIALAVIAIAGGGTVMTVLLRKKRQQSPSA